MKECLFMRVGFFGENQQRLPVEWSALIWISRLDGGGDPGLELTQQVPHGAQQLRVALLEIEMQDDERPARAIILQKRLFDNWLHALEEVFTQSRLVAGCFRTVTQRDPSDTGLLIDVPGQVLL